MPAITESTFLKAIFEPGSPERQALLDMVEAQPIDPVVATGSLSRAPVPQAKPQTPATELGSLARQQETNQQQAATQAVQQAAQAQQGQQGQGVNASDLFVPASLPPLPEGRASTGSGPTLGGTGGQPSAILQALQGQQVQLPSLAALLSGVRG